MGYYLVMKKIKVKLTKHDWLDAALQALAENGASAVAVEPLAKKLKVTKGSFYWHFKSRQALFDELLMFWESIELDYKKEFEQDDKIKASSSLRNILKILITDKTNKRVFLALSNNNDDSNIKEFHNRAVTRRLELFIRTYKNIGLSDGEAEKRASMTYCAYLGLIKSLNDGTTKLLSSRSETKLIDSVIDSAIYIDA